MEEAGVMNIHFAPDASRERRVKIKVVGVGGAGGNAVNRMVEAGLSEVDFYAVNTDGQALDTSRAHQTLVIGSQLTRGLGAGGDPSVGRGAAEEDREVLAGMVEDADMVFVTAGMGGGTGTGAAPIVAELARKGGALTVAVVTKPFMFEGFRRMAQAEAGLEALREHVDALLVIPNERLMDIDLPDGGMTEVFKVADNVLYEATRGISDIIAQHAVVNLDFADVRTVMQDSGAAIMGTGRAAGEDRAAKAAETAIRSPLLENVDIHGSRAVLVYISAGNVGRDDLRGAMNHIQQAAGADAHVFFGFANDESLGEDIQVTVIATGFNAAAPASDRPAATVAATAEPAAPVEAVPDVAATPMPVADDHTVEETAAEEPVVACDAPVLEEPATVSAEPSLDSQPSPPDDVFDTGPEIVLPPPPELPDTPDEVLSAEPVDLPEPPAMVAAPAETVMAEEQVRVDAVAEEPAVVAEPAPAQEAVGGGLAALAAAAGGQARVVEPSASVPASAPAPASDTSRRFLDPMGAVRIGGQDQPPTTAPAGQRFRDSVLGDDKMRPAWERKYVD
jgi:cell division protein FtsZ